MVGPATIPAAEEEAVNLNLVEELEAKRGAIKVADLTRILGVDDKHIYRMAARGLLPSFHVGAAVRFDPQEVAKWLRTKYGPEIPYARRALRSNRHRETRARSAASDHPSVQSLAI